MNTLTVADMPALREVAALIAIFPTEALRLALLSAALRRDIAR